MSVMAAVFNQLAQNVIPQVAELAFPDTLDVVVVSPAVDSGGGRYGSVTSDVVTNVPCRYDPIQKFGWEKETSERIATTQKYLLDMPTFHNGTRIDLDPNHHKLVINARMDGAVTVVPEFTFTIDSIGNKSGVAFSIVVSKED